MVSDRAFMCHLCIPWGKPLSFVPKSKSCADPGGGGGGLFPPARPPPPPPLEFWQKCGYRVREWDRFHIEQHLCSIQY